MQIDIKHQKSPALGWTIDVTVTADKNESISHVRIVVNDFPASDESPSAGVTKWHKTLVQQGVFPGDNKVVVTATDQNGNDTSGEDEWE